MNVKFFVNGRWYKTPCKTVLNADRFAVNFFTGKHYIKAFVSDKCYFDSIDNNILSDIKCDFYFGRNYHKPKEFLSNLYDTLDSFLSTTITFLPKLLGVKRPVCKNTDEILDILFEEVIAIDRETEQETETEPEPETEATEDTKPIEIIFDDENSKPEIRTKFYLLETYYRLNINHYYVELMTDKRIGDFYLYLKFDENGNEEKAMCKIFHLNAEYRNNAFETCFLYALAEKYNGLYCTPDYDDFAFYKRIAEECKTPETFEPFIASGEKCFFISPDKNNERDKTDIDNFNKKSAINSMYGITANSPEINNKYDETKELLAVEQFERLTGTLFKSLFKAIGLEETRRIPIIISNNMVFFNYNGTQYKYNPAQCKVYKKIGRRYLRINWKEFTDDNSPTDQKQARGRSPPFTPDIRSATIQ